MGRRRSSKEPQTVYLDTSVILCLVYGKAKDLSRRPPRDQVDYGNQLLSRLKREVGNPQIKIRIPPIVLGEATNKILESERDSDKLFKALRDVVSGLKIEYSGIGRDAVEIALEVAEKDDYLAREFSDCLIVGCALADEFSTRLITRDKAVLETKVIEEIDDRLRNEGKRKKRLNVTEYSR